MLAETGRPDVQTVDLKPFISKVAAGQTLSEEEAAQAFGVMMDGRATQAQIGALLMGLRVRGESVDEIVGAARVMREKSLRIDAPPGCVDTCGTGGDAKGSYNISTCVALVLAGAGVPVAKHGNRSISSRSGSADVLRELGVKIDAEPEVIMRCLEGANICFMFAPAHHAAMRHVAPARQELGARTIFNILGPLANPAGATRQVLGVFSTEWLEKMAEVLGRLGTEHAWIVHGSDGLDELTTTGPSEVAELVGGAVRRYRITPADAGLETCGPDDLRGGDTEENARAIQTVLNGAKGPFRDVVILNAAAAFIVSGLARSLTEGADRARAAIDGGGARESLARLVTLSNG